METTTDLGWTENGAATSWNVELVDVTAGGVATGNPTVTGVMNPYTVTGLVGDNNYQFYVQADCGVDGTSAWAGPFDFATPYVAVAPDCTNAIFLDSGGQSSDYSSSENITYTICPDNVGDVVNVVFTFFSSENNGIGCFDGLTIHNGADATATTIDPPAGGTIWCWDRNDTPAIGSGDLQGMTISSSDASGCLTFIFTSDGSLTRPGFQAMIFCNTLSTTNFSEPKADFTYYPNPVTDVLTINSKTDMDSIKVFNLLGQTVKSLNNNTTTAKVDMSDLSQGAYFVKVVSGALTKTMRIIKK